MSLNFKISPFKNIEEYIVELFLMVYQPRMYFVITYQWSIGAIYWPFILPALDFKRDPNQYWIPIIFLPKFVNFQT